jgi:hypothetical protein
LIDFCKRLIKSAVRKIFLLLDNLRVHHAMVFKPCEVFLLVFLIHRN